MFPSGSQREGESDHFPAIHESCAVAWITGHSKARIVKSLFSVGLCGAEVGGMSASHMNDVKELTYTDPAPWSSWPTEDLLEIHRHPRMAVWEHALDKGRGRLCDEQCFTWSEADYISQVVAAKRPDFGGLETGLSTQTFRQPKHSANKTEDSFRSSLNAALEGVWHEVRTQSGFSVGELCVRCKEEPEV
eukprot:1628259-Amphidinium_carterae.2